ncbi:hypothetical protein BH24CHL8_BH24CHL8_01680 [soil metagenome]
MKQSHADRVQAIVALRADGGPARLRLLVTEVAILLIATLDALRVELLGLVRGFRQVPGG